jgi:excisionase family DNA binding protein
LPRKYDLAFSASFNSERGVSMQSVKHDLPKIGYSIREACRATSIGRTRVYELIREGRLRATRIGGRTIIPAESLLALIAGEV